VEPTRNGPLPNQYYPQYILTGDPWYLNQMYMWMGTQISNMYPNWGPSHPYEPGGRGPNGAYGNIFDELRGEAWGIRTIAETAFAAQTAPRKRPTSPI
jgi:hypothetical protein